jgi:cysteinyl-tRNA synthetase
MISEEALSKKDEGADFAHRMAERFLQDSEELLNSRDIYFSRLSDYLEETTRLTESLMTKGVAYEKLRSVYFNISKAKEYGSLSGVDLEKIRLGARVDPESYEKLNPRDFTLLRMASLAELKAGVYLKSRWGNVVPTWHLAAMAMTKKHLGDEADIIVGSQDLVFPHLENIDALGRALTGSPPAELWLNANVVVTEGKKMSKVAGNTVSLSDLFTQGFKGREVRFWMLSTHYRKPLTYSPERLENARAGLKRIDDFVERLRSARQAENGSAEADQLIHDFEQRFKESLNQDLNAASGLTALFELIRGLNPVLDGRGLGEDQEARVLAAIEDADVILGVLLGEEEKIPREAKELAAEREEARNKKDFARADALREELKSLGYQAEDTPSGTRLKKLTQ